jgi:type II secretory pathway component GspD/PulD (secretin)
MSLLRLPPLLIGLAVALGLALPAALGREGNQVPSRTAKAAPRVARQVYALRGGQAKDLANVLALHFKAEPAFRAVPDPGSNRLLLSGPQTVLGDALAVLREIDRPARAVRVEVFLIGLTGKADGDGKNGGRVEWAGPAREVTAKVRDLQKRGWIASVQRIQLAALDGQSARTEAREGRPFTTSVALGRGGVASQSVSYRNIGTRVQVKPEIGADGLVGLELRLEDSRMRPAEGVTLAADKKKGANVPGTEFVTSTLETRLRVRPGRVVLAQGTASTSPSGQAQTVVLVSAATDEAGK